MRISYRLLVTVFACCAFGSVYAGVGEQGCNKKIYVSQNSIKLCKGGIRVKTADGFVTTRAIHTNKNGAYFLESEAVKVEKAWYQCRGCGLLFETKQQLRMHEAFCPRVR